MKKNTLIFSFMLLLFCFASAQPPFITPNTGLKFTFHDLVNVSGGTVVMEGAVFVIKNDVTISSLDSLVVSENITVKIYDGKILTISGSYWKVDPPSLATFTNYATGEHYATIRVESGSFVRLNKASFTYGSGIRIIDSNFEMDDCTLNHHNYSSQASGAITATTGKVIVKNSTFKNNVRSAFNSGANAGCTFEITNCYLENNVTENSNRPQINIGPSRTGEVSKILNSTILGNRSLTMVGGISTSSLLGVTTHYFIEGNTIKDNRYGITFTGSNITGTIKGNILQDNDTQNSPNLGGSGINITASGGNTHAIITQNVISGNLWGITLVGATNFSTGPTANIGNISVPETNPEYNIGRNIFFNNGNEGELFDLYNNNPNDVMAQNNNWGIAEQTEELIRTVIRDNFNNPNYGTVTFMPPYIIPEICDSIKNLVVLYAPDCNKAELTWETPSEGNYKYNIYRDGTFLTEVIHETSFTDEGFDFWEEHTWTVIGVCENGEESDPVEKSLLNCTGCQSASHFTVEIDAECSSAKLSWSYPVTNVLFHIYRDEEIIKEKHDTNTFTDTNFNEGSHTWKIVVLCKEELESGPVSVTEECVVGIPNIDLIAFTIVPNPARDKINISANFNFDRVDVINFLGQTVLSQSVTGNATIVDVSNLLKGVYLIRIFSENTASVQKFVRQ
jgi:parallel beta-helix repeat protein